jgi:hypothetical protein
MRTAVYRESNGCGRESEVDVARQDFVVHGIDRIWLVELAGSSEEPEPGDNQSSERVSAARATDPAMSSQNHHVFHVGFPGSAPGGAVAVPQVEVEVGSSRTRPECRHVAGMAHAVAMLPRCSPTIGVELGGRRRKRRGISA